MPLELREMLHTDIVAAQDLLVQLGYPIGAGEVERRHKAVRQGDGHGVFVAEEGGRVIALLHVYARPALDKPPEAVVQAIVVDQAYRGGGVGKALMAAAENWAAERGFRSVALTSSISRSAAHAFYSELGYRCEATSHLFRKNLALRLESIVSELPAGFDRLRAEAQAGGYRHLDRLAADWVAGAMRFDRDGEALVSARLNEVLVGIGGLTLEPSQPGALRMRRFYVRASSRGQGVGRALAQHLLDNARARHFPVTVNAAAGSEPFWESLGFVPAAVAGYTHVRPSEVVV